MMRYADVKITAMDPAGVLSDAVIAAEEKDIKEEVSGVSAFATLMLSYHF